MRKTTHVLVWLAAGLPMLFVGCGGEDTSAPQSGGAGSESSPPLAGKADSFDQLCNNPQLQWKSANKTNYTSHPDPGSAECIEYNGCYWAGQFAYCDGTFSEEWVKAHNIAAVFPSTGLQNHDLCLRAGGKTIVVTAIDTCADTDCSGCCTENRGSADRLIDLEKYTNERWGIADGPIEWADLGRNAGGGDCSATPSAGSGSSSSSGSGSTSSCQLACGDYGWSEGQCKADAIGNSWSCEGGCLHQVDECGTDSTENCQYRCADYNYRPEQCHTDSNNNSWYCDGTCLSKVDSCG